MDLATLTHPAPPSTAAPATANGLVEAIIATTAADVASEVFVLIGAGQQRSGPCDWLPRGDLLPTRGQRCYVQQTNLGRLVVVQWGPGVEEPSRAVTVTVAGGAVRTITHGLDTPVRGACKATVVNATTFDEWNVGVNHTSTDALTVDLTNLPGATNYHVTVIG